MVLIYISEGSVDEVRIFHDKEDYEDAIGSAQRRGGQSGKT